MTRSTRHRTARDRLRIYALRFRQRARLDDDQSLQRGQLDRERRTRRDEHDHDRGTESVAGAAGARQPGSLGRRENQEALTSGLSHNRTVGPAPPHPGEAHRNRRHREPRRGVRQ